MRVEVVDHISPAQGFTICIGKLIEREMPFSIRKASKLLHEQFIRFMDIQDLDERTDKNGGYTIFSEAFTKFAPNVSKEKNHSSSDGASYDDE